MRMRTVVALYDRLDEAQQAVQALVDAQFHREDINLVSRDATGAYAGYLNRTADRSIEEGSPRPESGAAAGAGIGAVLGGLGGLLLGLSAIVIPGIGPVIAAGPIIAGLAGAGVGAVAGGLLGGLTNMGIPEEHAQYYAEGIRRGGTLVVTRTEDQDAERARQVLNRFRPVDIETRTRTWRDAGWNQFDPNAMPLSAQQMEFNRTADMPVTGGPVTPGPVTPSVTDQFDSGMDEHLSEDVYSKERTNNQVIDLPVTGGQVQETEIRQTGVRGWSDYDSDFHQDYLVRYGRTGYGYDYYQPAYRYGYDLATDPRYRGYDWNQVAPEARRQYERSGLQGTWDDIKDAVQHAWEAVTGR
jgi:hypothetical protein